MIAAVLLVVDPVITSLDPTERTAGAGVVMVHGPVGAIGAVGAVGRLANAAAFASTLIPCQLITVEDPVLHPIVARLRPTNLADLASRRGACRAGIWRRARRHGGRVHLNIIHAQASAAVALVQRFSMALHVVEAGPIIAAMAIASLLAGRQIQGALAPRAVTLVVVMQHLAAVAADRPVVAVVTVAQSRRTRRVRARCWGCC